MKVRGRVIGFIVLVSMLVSIVWACIDIIHPFEYYYIGSFASRAEGQEKALEHLLRPYAFVFSDECKVLYEYPVNGYSLKESLWYDQAKEELSLKTDVHSGPIAQWENITKHHMENLVLPLQKGIPIDSLLVSH